MNVTNQNEFARVHEFRYYKLLKYKKINKSLSLAI